MPNIVPDDDLPFCNDFDEPGVFATTPTPTTIDGTFTGGTKQTLMFGQAEVAAATPSFTVRTAICGFVRTKMNVTINSVIYKVEDIEDTGTGITVLWLRTN